MRYKRGQILVFTKRSSLNGPDFGEEGDEIEFLDHSRGWSDRCEVRFHIRENLYGRFYALYSEIQPSIKEYKLDQQLDDAEDLL